MHCVITDILCELPFHGVDLPLTCPIPAYWMRHPDHLDFMRHPDQFGNRYTSDGGFIGEATESWGSWALRELPFYGVDLPLFTYELHRTGPGQHDFDLSIEGTFQVRRKNYGVLYDVLDGGFRLNMNFLYWFFALQYKFLSKLPFFERLALSSGKRKEGELPVARCSTYVSTRNEKKKKIASKNFAKSELPFWDAGGVESPFWEMQRKLLSFEGREVTYLRNQNTKMKLKVVVPPMT
ncbi:hypothetical protein B0H16DRAFT_1479521 [Mycena metata]|uniref:Uncharacterized protein n=1 Tax=Mycena metata TaxID=1033252 RepID=A0AAD7H587_9AGAR|nr:hypothetical protein B0H16DRAFT_1479521 [Mycena metata]